MNKSFLLSISLFATLLSCSTIKNNKTNSYKDISSISDTWEIATWKNFSQSAITHTWDDNTAKQLNTALPIYDEFGLKATFFIVSTWNPDWSNFKKASQNGHEIASHTLNHISFANQSSSKIFTEMSGSQNLINEKMGNKNCLTMAYPFCITENYNLAQKFFIAARICDGKIVPKIPLDFMNISSFVCGTESNYKTAANFNAISDKAFSENGWAVYLFHGIDNDGGYSPINSSELRIHLHYLNSNKKKFWVDTFVNIAKYIKEREEATIKQTNSNNILISANLTNNLDPMVYNYPITLKKEIPLSWSSITVKQNNTVIDFKIITESSKKYVLLNIIPNSGEIQIIKK